MSDNAARWLRLSRLFDQAIELPANARDAFIAESCAQQPALAEALHRMLSADAAASAFDAGAGHVVALGDDDDDEATAALAGDDTPARLGAWRLAHVLGRGGMGTVHAARRDDDTGQRAAIKRLRRRWDGSGQAQRFLQERRILATLSHPHIPRLLDHGLDADGQPWFALEFVDGQPLTAAADAQRLGLRERIALMLQVCAALRHAHEHFVVHRDLKPANILVDAQGHARVLDFGVAKRIDAAGSTRTGMAAGFTPEYAAPEQVTGGTISAATDVHALGVLLYELLTGRLPHRFAGHDLRAATEAISSGQAPRLEQAITSGDAAAVAGRLQARGTDLRGFRRFVRGDLGRILQTALAKEPVRRYASVQAFADDLQRFLDGRPVSVGGDTPGYRMRKFVQRNRWGVAMAAIAALALGTGIGGMLLKSHEARIAAAHAREQAALAQAEARRQQAVSAFLFQVFSAASLDSAGRPDISLREALDLAVDQAVRAQGRDPVVAVVTLRAAANSLSQWDERERAVALVQQALALQQARLPDDTVEHARLLGLLALVDYERDMLARLAPARESLALMRSAGRPIDVIQAASLVGSVLIEGGYPAEALPVSEAVVRAMREAGLQDDPGYDTALGSLANNLAMVGEHARASDLLFQVVEASQARYGEDSLQVARDRMFLGMALVRAGRDADALAPLALALPVLRHKAGDGNTITQMAVHWTAGALSNLGRDAEALPYHEEAYRAAWQNTYNSQRLASVSGRYAAALARLGHCDAARAALDRLHAQGGTPAAVDTGACSG